MKKSSKVMLMAAMAAVVMAGCSSNKGGSADTAAPTAQSGTESTEAAAGENTYVIGIGQFASMARWTTAGKAFYPVCPRKALSKDRT